MDIKADIEFAKAEAGWSQADVLRYVAAINPEATKRQFVTEVTALGYHSGSAANRFSESRKTSLSCGDCAVDSEGRLTDLPFPTKTL